MSEQNRIKDEPEIKGEQKRNNVSLPSILACLLLGILILVILNMDHSPLLGDDVFDRRYVTFYFIIFPIILMGFACGLPYYRYKDIVIFGLLLNVFVWITGLIAMILAAIQGFGYWVF